MRGKDLVNETCEAILDTTKTIYNEEAERFKQIESKASISIAFSGVLIAAYLAYLSNYEPQTSDIGYFMYTFIFKIVVFFFLFKGILYFFKSIRAAEYSQVRLEEIVTYEFAREREGVAKMDIAATYQEAIGDNRGKMEMKLKIYNFGVKYMTLGLIVFAIHFIVEEVIKHVL